MFSGPDRLPPTPAADVRRRVAAALKHAAVSINAAFDTFAFIRCPVLVAVLARSAVWGVPSVAEVVGRDPADAVFSV